MKKTTKTKLKLLKDKQ